MPLYRNLFKLYLYNTDIELLMVDRVITGIRRDNRPMNNQFIKLHKGVDNQIRFQVVNPDRKPQSITHLTVTAYLVSTENKERVFEKNIKLSSDKGVMQLEVLEGELVTVAPGFYRMTITAQEKLTPTQVGEIIGSPFYSDLDSNITIPVEVVASADTTPIDSKIVESTGWIPDHISSGEFIYYSSSFPANRVKNQLNNLHSFSIKTTGYTGTIQVLGSLELNPVLAEPERDFFPIEVEGIGTDIVYTDETSIKYYNIRCNCMWIKFKRIQTSVDTGIVDKLIFRG